MRHFLNNYKALFLLLCVSLVFTNCERDLDELELDEATNPTTGEVFIDAFSAGLEYAAFAGSDVTAFEVDTDVKYAGNASMRIAVPDFEDPKGAFAGGVYFTEVGRDLSQYNVLTFWARASQAANIDLIGFGNDLDLGDNVYQAAITNVPVTSNWQKYYIPIPEASKLTDEKGMFFYSEGPENGRGYTFWFDEVKFETITTLAHASAQIMGGQDVTSEAETGNSFTVDAVSVFNLPSGVNQTVVTAPAYFTFTSSNPTVASVDDQGVVNVLDAGTSVITATLGEIEAEGSLTIVSTGEALLPATAAPSPDQEAEDVISVFSNAYQNIPVDFYNGFWEFSTTDNEVVQVDGDEIMRYTMLNFVGIQFTAPTQDISQMTHFHMDIWTPDATDLPNTFKILLVDIGPDGAFDGNDNSQHEVTITSPTLKSEEWVSIDLPLTDFPGLTGRMNLAQIVLSGELMNVFADNIYFYKDENGGGGGMGPLTGAPIPDEDPADVISVFSDSYNNVADTDFNPNWGQATIVTQESIDGNNTLKYTGLNYQGVQLANPIDASGMEFLHIDYWTDNSSALNSFLISSGPVETAVGLAVPTSGWTSLDIPLTEFAGVDLSDIIQFKFDGNGTVYLDNIYFFRGGGGGGGMGPSMAAPTPEEDPANVISVYSDSYSNIPGSDLNPDWGQATVVTEELIDGNNTLKYEGLNYQGLMLGSASNVSGMEFLHIDFWTDNSSALSTFLISPGPAETAYALSVPTSGWSSVDIPLSDFAGVDLNEIIQMKFEGDGTIYLDNIYFYREGGGGGMGPNTGAPTPDEDAADVISIFSDSYMNVPDSDYNPNWGQATVVTQESINGNNTLKYEGLNYQGLQLANPLDVSGMEFLHLDYWTDNSSALSTFLISDGPVEVAYGLNVPTSGWESIDIPLSEFAGVDLMDIIQFKFEGDGTVYLDNIYFYREGGGGGNEPGMAAPAPTLPEANVISLFSNSYNDVPVDTWRTEWSSAILEDIQINGNDTKKYSQLDFVGIETVANPIDASGMTHFHIDVWSADFEFFAVKIVDFGADGAFGGGDDVEHQIDVPMPNQGEWVSFDFLLSDFTGLTTRSNLAQFILVGQPTGNNTVFVDNVYLHN